MTATGKLFRPLCLALLLIATIPFAAHAFEQPVTIAVSYWPPYLEKDDPTQGMASELVVKALGASGIKVRFVFVPWARALDGVRHGTFAASFPWLITSERQNFAWFSQPIMLMRYVFFYRRDKHKRITFQTLEELRRYSIVGMLGYYYERPFLEAGLNVDYKLNGDIAFRMLEAGRADLLAEDEAVGWYLLKKDYPQAIDIFASTRPFMVMPGHLIVSKKLPDGQKLVEAFDRGMQMLQGTGEYERIVGRYRAKGVPEP
ncbi:substrate-binding periplasmic protein [Salidesulfovibrio onnuriiensis]|uniref:substrate-binding periplasmic protein n=1 Tax=Salidesulfovibrio onnuriiensis TaxID=2583823 RepID=UPI0011CBE40E|nr:transporter substrate-binding domain-containing protein [Salidesulfovibrio onnuriiensis]